MIDKIERNSDPTAIRVGPSGEVNMLNHHRIIAAIELGIPIEVDVLYGSVSLN
jgi:hypothetical protein